MNSSDSRLVPDNWRGLPAHTIGQMVAIYQTGTGELLDWGIVEYLSTANGKDPGSSRLIRMGIVDGQFPESTRFVSHLRIEGGRLVSHTMCVVSIPDSFRPPNRPSMDANEQLQALLSTYPVSTEGSLDQGIRISVGDVGHRTDYFYSFSSTSLWLDEGNAQLQNKLASLLQNPMEAIERALIDHDQRINEQEQK